VEPTVENFRSGAYVPRQDPQTMDTAGYAMYLGQEAVDAGNRGDSDAVDTRQKALKAAHLAFRNRVQSDIPELEAAGYDAAKFKKIDEAFGEALAMSGDSSAYVGFGTEGAANKLMADLLSGNYREDWEHAGYRVSDRPDSELFGLIRYSDVPQADMRTVGSVRNAYARAEVDALKTLAGSLGMSVPARTALVPTSGMGTSAPQETRMGYRNTYLTMNGLSLLEQLKARAVAAGRESSEVDAAFYRLREQNYEKGISGIRGKYIEAFSKQTARGARTSALETSREASFGDILDNK